MGDSADEMPRKIIEPAIEITVEQELPESLAEIVGEDEISLTLLDQSPVQDLEGPTNDEYPISAEFGTQENTDQLNFLMTDNF